MGSVGSGWQGCGDVGAVVDGYTQWKQEVLTASLPLKVKMSFLGGPISRGRTVVSFRARGDFWGFFSFPPS